MSERPSWRARLLRLVVPAGTDGEVLADLEERYRAVAGARGGLSARLWLARQLAAWVMLGLPGRLMEGLRTYVVADLARGDISVALRRLRASPAMGLAVVATLALGIGGTTAAWSVVDAVLLRPLPFAEPHELYAVHGDRGGQSWWFSSASEFGAWRAAGRELAWAQSGAMTLTAGGDPVHVRSARVSPGFFGFLGVPLLYGRDFAAGEDLAGAGRVTILTWGVWQSRFGGALDIVGTPVILDGEPYTVIGITAADIPLDFLRPHEILVPRPMPRSPDPARVVQAVVRVRGGDPDAAAADLQRVLEEAGVPSAPDWTQRLVPLREELVGDVRPVLLLVLGAVVCVLLVACFNVTSLLLARTQSRRDEAVVRSALGAGRARLFRQALVESVILGGLGGVAGLALASWGTSLLTAGRPELLPRTATGLTDGAVLFAVVLALVSGLTFGVASGIAFVRAGHGTVRASRAVTPGRGEGRAGAVLVACEMAFALVLMVGAGLMVRSLDALRAVDPGYDLEDTWVADVALSSGAYPDVEAQTVALERLREALAAVPGIDAAGGISSMPLRGPGFTGWHVVESQTVVPGQEPTGGVEMADPDYFRTMGIPLVEGRVFDALEAAESRTVAVVDEAMVRTYWQDRSPIGDRVRFGPAAAGWFEVIGVVGSVRYAINEDPRPRFYVPERRLFGPLSVRSTVFRSSLPAAQLLPTVRSVIGQTLPDAPVVRTERFADLATESLAMARLQATLLSIFGLVGLALGAVGVYGLVNYQVGRRTREMGLRLALGARAGEVIREVLVRALIPVLAGVAAGMAGALLLGDAARRVTYDVDAASPVLLAILVGVLLLVAMAAALAPALRAAQLDPSVTLRA